MSLNTHVTFDPLSVMIENIIAKFNLIPIYFQFITKYFIVSHYYEYFFLTKYQMFFNL
jgi:hypothetical protein